MDKDSETGVRNGECDRTGSRTEEQRDHRKNVSDMVRGDRGSSKWRHRVAVMATMHRTAGAGTRNGRAERNWLRTYADLCWRRTVRTSRYTGISRSIGPRVRGIRHGTGAKGKTVDLSARICAGIPKKARIQLQISARNCTVSLRRVSAMYSPSTSSVNRVRYMVGVDVGGTHASSGGLFRLQRGRDR